MRHVAGDHRFITGIHNYCNRWCERCGFTARCHVYAMEQKDDDDPSARDPQNRAFWGKLQSILEQTLDMVAAWAAEQGIALEALDVEAAEHEAEQRRAAADNHELARAARRYAELVDAELAPVEDVAAASAMFSDNADEAPETIGDAVAVVRWYQYLIRVKILRALTTPSFVSELEREVDGQSDADGSIKVALIGMDHSIAAWLLLRQDLPAQADGIPQIVLHLERLRRKTELAFPEARRFVRPGFDSVPDHRLQ